MHFRAYFSAFPLTRRTPRRPVVDMVVDDTTGCCTGWHVDQKPIARAQNVICSLYSTVGRAHIDTHTNHLQSTFQGCILKCNYYCPAGRRSACAHSWRWIMMYRKQTHTHSLTVTRTHVTNVLSSDQYGTELLPDCDRHDVKSIVPTGRPWIQSNHAELVAGVFVINTNTHTHTVNHRAHLGDAHCLHCAFARDNRIISACVLVRACVCVLYVNKTHSQCKPANGLW